MLLLVAILVVLVLSLLYVKGIFCLSPLGRLPPGPTGYPILGAIPLLKKQLHVSYREWAQTYGDIFSLYFGQKVVIVVSGIDAIREVFVKNGDCLLDRPKTLKKGVYNIGEGIILGDGPVWREHRRQLVKGLRILGTGEGNSLEARVSRECSELVKQVSSQVGKSFDPTEPIYCTVMNISFALFYGTRLDCETTRFKTAYRILKSGSELDIGSPLLVLPGLVPFLKPICSLFRWNGDKVLKEVSRDIAQFVREMIAEQRVSYQAGVTRGILDVYINRQISDSKEGKTCCFDERELIQVAFDLFIAAADTTTTTLRWGILYVLRFPDVLAKVQDEIDDVIGRERVPTMADRERMPYTEATLCEIQRCGNISSVGVPHQTNESFQVSGYDIPAGSTVMLNLHYLMEDHRYWDDPSTFNPSRFLDEERKVKKPDAFIPFGIGPRACLGDNLAKIELFLMFVCLLQRFNLSVPEGENAPSMEIRRGITLSPHPYNICAEPRQYNS